MLIILAIRIPRTPILDSAREYRIPREKSLRARPGPKGITAQPSRLKIRVSIGAIKNRNLLACAGITCSLITSLRASAT